MCVARYASHYFSKGAICVPLVDQEKNICTLSSHRATRELYAKMPSHRAPVGALCEGSMRIELRSELYAKGALCGSTTHIVELYLIIPVFTMSLQECWGYFCAEMFPWRIVDSWLAAGPMGWCSFMSYIIINFVNAKILMIRKRYQTITSFPSM